MIKSTIMSLWYKYNHSIILAIIVTICSLFGYGLYSLLTTAGFWAGREHSQAEYRYMNIHNIYRIDLDFFDGFKSEAWNKDSFLNDLVIPVLLGIAILIAMK